LKIKEYAIDLKSDTYLMFYIPHFSAFFDYYQVYPGTKYLEEGITATSVFKHKIRSLFYAAKIRIYEENIFFIYILLPYIQT